MKRLTLRRGLSRMTAIGVSSALLVAMAASPAAADTSNATANAVHVTLGASTLLDTGTCIASNSPPPAGPPCTVATALSNLNTLVAASVITQSATASGSSSGACAGVSGPGGGAIQVAASGLCIPPVNPAAGGVVLLGGLVTANAVYATCSSVGGAAPTGSATTLALNAANTSGGLLSLGGLLATLGTVAVNPASTATHIIVSLTPLLGGTPVDLLTLDLNTQTTAGSPAMLTVTALDLKVLTGLTNLTGIGPLLAGLGLAAGSVAEVRLGQVTCGPNLVTAPIPVVPLAGTPIAAGLLLIAGFLGWRFWWTPRRRAATSSV